MLKTPNNTITIIKSITNSQYLDVIGLVVVLLGSISLGYHKTVFTFSFENITYNFPLGIVSIVNVGFSLIGNRLVTKKNNFGNLLATINTFFSGFIDYLLGNVGAILTYPVTFVGNYLVFKAWKKTRTLRSIDVIFYRNILLGFMFSFLLNFIAFYFLTKETVNWQLFFAISIPAGITFGATFNTARMYPDNWFMWQFYNVTKLIQNLLQMNWANVIKYCFYLVNAILGYITWNDDKKIAEKLEE